ICDDSVSQRAESSGNSISMLIAGSYPMIVPCSFSFLNVCQLLNLAPETVREDVLDDLPLRAFAYYTRRCGGAARRFNIFLGSIFTNERSTDAAEPVTWRAHCTNIKGNVFVRKFRRICRPLIA